MKPIKKIAFFGTPPFTVQFLETLRLAGYTPSLIITNPDRPSGRGMQLSAPEPKVWAKMHAIKVLQSEKLDDAFFDELSKETWDLFLVVAYGKIIPERIITLPTYGTINVHYSLLPAYRGATPVESAIVNGEKETGVCIQQMRYKLDTGPVYVKSDVAIDPNDTSSTLREKLNNEALRLIVPTMEHIFKGSVLPIEQDEALASHSKKISKEDGEISLTDDPLVLDRKFRAYQPWPGIYFYIEKGGKRVRIKIKTAHLQDGQFMIDTVVPENGKLLSKEEFDRWIRD